MSTGGDLPCAGDGGAGDSLGKYVLDRRPLSFPQCETRRKLRGITKEEDEMKPETMMIDDVKYVREDSIRKSEIGEKRIIVADRGWVFAGDCEDHEDGSVTIRNAKNIRRWGTSTGLGELANGPTSKTVVDPAGTVRCTPIVSFAIISGW